MVRFCCPALIHIYKRSIYGSARVTARFVGIQQHTLYLFFFAATQRLLFQLLCFASNLRLQLQAHHDIWHTWCPKLLFYVRMFVVVISTLAVMNVMTLLCIAFKQSNADGWTSDAKLESSVVVYFVNGSCISLASPEQVYRKHYAASLICFFFLTSYDQ